MQNVPNFKYFLIDKTVVSFYSIKT